MTLTMAAAMPRDMKWVHALAAAAFLVASAPHVPLAQGLDSEEAIDKIVGSDVKTEQAEAETDAERIVAAVGNSADNAERVRKAFNLNELHIVFVPDLGQNAEGIDAAIAENDDQIAALREAIEGSAIFYHAVDSRQIAVDNILALEFGEDDNATIFVAGDDPNG